MPRRDDQVGLLIALVILMLVAIPVFAQDMSQISNSENRPTHLQSAAQRNDDTPKLSREPEPAIPKGMTLVEVFDLASSPPPASFPQPVPDDKLYAFTLFEQLEYQIVTNDGSVDQLGWESQGWIGGDFNKFWWKNEGEAIFDGDNEGEMETDLLYSHLIAPFWNFQVGAQYANEWNADAYEDRWSSVIGLQGLAPYKFELDNSLYISEDGDTTFAFEAEYNIRITQRVVLQPRAELGIALQNIPGRDRAAGFTNADLALRLRYEIKRQFAPYIGVRYQTLLGETDNIAEDKGLDSEKLFVVVGLRFAF